MLHNFSCLLAASLALAGLLLGVHAVDEAHDFINTANFTNGGPARLRSFLAGYFGTTKARSIYFGGNDEDTAAQIQRYDPSHNTSNITTEIFAAPNDSGTPDDLPDLGVPPILWRGPGGPWDDYSNGTITYKYTCGQEATGVESGGRTGAHDLRNMDTETAFTPAHSCARHWCHDTTAMFVCNDMDADLTIPYYNIGWMTDRINRLCCDDAVGKSGRMWHYRLNYSVVLGYANCRTDPTTNSPYPYGEGNNGFCIDYDSIPHDGFK